MAQLGCGALCAQTNASGGLGLISVGIGWKVPSGDEGWEQPVMN